MRKKSDNLNGDMLTLKSAFLKASSVVTSNSYLLTGLRTPGLVRSRSYKKPFSVLLRQQIEDNRGKHKYLKTNECFNAFTKKNKNKCFNAPQLHNFMIFLWGGEKQNKNDK